MIHWINLFLIGWLQVLRFALLLANLMEDFAKHLPSRAYKSLRGFSMGSLATETSTREKVKFEQGKFKKRTNKVKKKVKNRRKNETKHQTITRHPEQRPKKDFGWRQHLVQAVQPRDTSKTARELVQAPKTATNLIFSGDDPLCERIRLHQCEYLDRKA